MNIKKYIPDNKSFNIDTDFLTSLSENEIKPYIPKLSEWVQDMNWPVAQGTAKVLVHFQSLSEPYIVSLLKPSQEDDIWKYWLITDVVSKYKNDLSKEMKAELERIAKTPTSGEKNECVDLEAAELLLKFSNKS